MTDRLKERLADFTYVEDYGDYDAMVHPDICDEALDRITQLEAAAAKVLEWWPDGSETGAAITKIYGSCFAEDIQALRAALHQGDRKP